MTFSTEFIAGCLFTVALAVFGYFVRRQDAAITKLEIGQATLEADLKESRHELRNEMNKIVLNEEVRRTEAIRTLEVRFSQQIDRVIELVNNKHDDLKSDIRAVAEDVRALRKQ